MLWFAWVLCPIGVLPCLLLATSSSFGFGGCCCVVAIFHLYPSFPPRSREACAFLPHFILTKTAWSRLARKRMTGPRSPPCELYGKVRMIQIVVQHCVPCQLWHTDGGKCGSLCINMGCYLLCLWWTVCIFSVMFFVVLDDMSFRLNVVTAIDAWREGAHWC